MEEDFAVSIKYSSFGLPGKAPVSGFVSLQATTGAVLSATL